jgi:hypothetical protein
MEESGCECGLPEHTHPEGCSGATAYVVQTFEAWEEGPGSVEPVFLCAECAPDAVRERIGPLTLPGSQATEERS